MTPWKHRMGTIWYLVQSPGVAVGTVTMVLGDGWGLLLWYLVMSVDCYHGTW